LQLFYQPKAPDFTHKQQKARFAHWIKNTSLREGAKFGIVSSRWPIEFYDFSNFFEFLNFLIFLKICDFFVFF